MNWARPEAAKAIAHIYTSDPAYKPYVSEVVLLHLNPASAFVYAGSRAVRGYSDFAANGRLGLASRFAGCLLAEETEVLVQDDDVLVTPSGMRHLLEARAAVEHPAQLVGFRGRDWNHSAGGPQYVRVEVGPGPRPIALTIALATHRAVCAAFFRHAPAVEDLVAQSRPLWNGEDIFLSLVSFKLTGGVMPLILPGAWPKRASTELQYLEDTEKTGMHQLYKEEHFAHRDRFLKEAAQRLGVHQELGQVAPHGDAADSAAEPAGVADSGPAVLEAGAGVVVDAHAPHERAAAGAAVEHVGAARKAPAEGADAAAAAATPQLLLPPLERAAEDGRDYAAGGAGAVQPGTAHLDRARRA